MSRHAVVYERAGRGYSAYVPDLPGCVATGRTRAEVERRIREAIEAHVSELRRSKEAVPAPGAWTGDVDI